MDTTIECVKVEFADGSPERYFKSIIVVRRSLDITFCNMEPKYVEERLSGFHQFRRESDGELICTASPMKFVIEENADHF